MKKVTILLALLLLCTYHPCFAYIKPETGGFRLEFMGENNLFPVDVTLKKLKKELPAELIIPEDILYRNRLFLSLPLGQRRSMSCGLFYRKAGFIHATGQTLRFYRCYANPNFPHEKKYYDLAGEYLNYSLFGSYISKEWNQGSFRVTLRGDLFTCYDYQKLSIQGQGWIQYRLNGSKYYELYGNYRREQSPPENPWGWGLALSYSFYYEHNGLTIDLNLFNLPSRLYFPQLVQENGRVDTEEDSIGPLPIKGFTTEGADFRSLPPLAEFQATYTVKGGGAFSGTVMYNGWNQDLLLGYRQALGDIGLTVMVNPVYQNYGFGFDTKYGALILMFGWERPGTLRGVNFKLQF